MAQVSAQWRRLVTSKILQRSSQIISVIHDTVYVFGGELRPREPRDNDVHVIKIQRDASLHPSVATLSSNSHSPPPRVGAASTTLHQKIYMFSGRGGSAMTPVEEHGSFWVFDPSKSQWDFLSPKTASHEFPEARSYHTLTSDGGDIIYLHAGCPEKGRLSDLWSFHVSSRSWSRLASAPDPPRGGTSIAFSEGLVYRMNGFDGNTELGGSVDIYSPDANAWTTHSYAADGRSGPGPRSVGALVSCNIGGRPSLVTLFGERDPSALGHQGAGKMLSDIWILDLQSKVWNEAQVRDNKDASIEGGLNNYPASRGWFAAEPFGHGIVVQGGLGESNDRLNDAWLLEFDDPY